MKTAWLTLYGKPAPLSAQVDPSRDRVRCAGHDLAAGDLRFEPPATGTVYGTALNFRGALAALGAALNAPPYVAPPRAPILYLKPRNTWIGRGAPIPLPQGHEALAIGPTLGLVIGRSATRVTPAAALEHVAGYTIVNDVALPHSSLFRPAIAQQCRDGFCPIGPWVLAASELPDPDDVAIRVFINGQERLASHTRELIRPVRQLLADVTEFMTLQRGDILLVGLPENLPLARAGDQVVVEIAGLGRLENPVLNASAVPP